MTEPLKHWRLRMIELKSHEPLIEAPEPTRKPIALARGYVAFALRLGYDPRCAHALLHWKSRMKPIKHWKVRARELAHIEDYKTLREQFHPPVPVDTRQFLGPAPSPAASRLVPALPRRRALRKTLDALAMGAIP